MPRGGARHFAFIDTKTYKGPEEHLLLFFFFFFKYVPVVLRLNGDIDMDIPLGYHKLENYCATLAHKVKLISKTCRVPDPMFLPGSGSNSNILFHRYKHSQKNYSVIKNNRS